MTATDTLHKPLTPAMEDYLEAIFNLAKEKRVVRVKNIAGRLGVKMPTVTNMLKTLSKKGLIEYEKYEYLELTNRGSAIGREIDRRHNILDNFLTDILKINAKTANEEACRMEHGISHATMHRLIEFMEFLQSSSRDEPICLQDFDRYLQNNQNRDKYFDRMKELPDASIDRKESMQQQEKKSDDPQQD
ncbi:MAG: metal-dependent transcriptional regulator [Thermodesulfobacteriota bacterium]|nr:metal-dependent transcriptional regulator [Thermodesulfobacteriota bacterium]